MGPRFGSLAVEVATQDPDSDAGPYELTLDDTLTVELDPDDLVLFESVRGGTHTLALDGVPPRCTTFTRNPLPVDVGAGEERQVRFRIECAEKQRLLLVANAFPDSLWIAMVAIDGSSKVDIPNTGDATDFDYSPAAERLAIQVRERWVSVITLGLDGSGRRNLTVPLGLSGFDPSWSPDGSRIAFFGSDTLTLERALYTMSADGTDLRRLIATDRLIADPDWSPDGSTIVFMSLPPGTGYNWDIEAINADGTGRRSLVAGNTSSNFAPAFSPDGSEIAFCSEPVGRLSSILLMQADGSGQQVILSDPSSSLCHPAWAPDGSRISYWGLTEGEIFVGDRDGTILGSVTGPLGLGVLGRSQWMPAPTPPAP